MQLQTKIRLLSAATLLGAAGFAASANAAIVVDGTFDNPSGGSSFTTYGTGTVAGLDFSSWHVGTGTVDLIGGYWQNPGGVGGSVDLDGNAPGSISQNLTLGAGTYQLTFDLSGNPDGGDATKSLAVSVGSASQNFSFTTGSNTKSSMNYLSETLTFTTSGNTTLTFASTDTSGPYGAVIGNVSVTAVPEPATAGLALLGLGVLGFAARRRRTESMSAAIA